jgi:CheY-like chemotaxis protein
MRKKILVVEDDPDIGDMLQLILEERGYVVELQVDGQVVQEMQEPFPDLLFLDIRLAGTDGRTICRQLKGNPATHHIPIILLSAHNGMQDTARDAGAEMFLAKPFEMEELLALAAHYLGNDVSSSTV